jgi:hypothetical protein
MTRKNWVRISAVSLIALCCAVLLAVGSHRTAAQESSAEQQATPTSTLATATISEPVGFNGPIATTNIVDTTIRLPRNTGTNTFTLQCMSSSVPVLLPLTLAPGQVQASFSCSATGAGPAVETITETCTGTTGVCKLSFVP